MDVSVMDAAVNAFTGIFATAGAASEPGAHSAGSTIISILIILVAAKIAAEVAERLHMPAVAGEILAGIAIGPSVLGLVKPNDVLTTLGEIGVILLLLDVGMHMDLRELRAVGRRAMSVAVVGVALPFASGYLVCHWLGMSTNESVFIGAALTATSVGITARVFGDLQSLSMREARTVLGAAVADDVIGLIVLTVVVRIVSGDGSVSATSIGGVVVLSVGFLVLCTAFGLAAVPRVLAFVERRAVSSATLFVLALVIALGFAQLATLAKLAPIIGAFVAGLALAKSSHSSRLQREFVPIGHLFIPVFFLQIGINVDVSAFGSARVLGIAAALSVVAVVGKVLAGVVAGGSRISRLLVGVGMIPRGEVGLIFAAIGLRENVLDNDLYASVLLTVVVTTLITPPLLGICIRKARANVAPDPATSAESFDISAVRRADATSLLTENGALRERVEHAPLHYVLANSPEVLARHARLVEEAEESSTYAVNVTRLNAQTTIEIAARDRVGLLAHTTGALGRLGVAIHDAMITTWGDGMALQVFVTTPEAEFSTSALEELLDHVPNIDESTVALADATVLFDNQSSPWHTVAELRATDRVGLLHNVAVLFASIGIDVHGARVTTSEEMVRDVFELTDREGAKLTDVMQAIIRAAIADGDATSLSRQTRLEHT